MFTRFLPLRISFPLSPKHRPVHPSRSLNDTHQPPGSLHRRLDGKGRRHPGSAGERPAHRSAWPRKPTMKIRALPTRVMMRIVAQWAWISWWPGGPLVVPDGALRVIHAKVCCITHLRGKTLEAVQVIGPSAAGGTIAEPTGLLAEVPAAQQAFVAGGRPAPARGTRRHRRRRGRRAARPAVPGRRPRPRPGPQHAQPRDRSPQTQTNGSATP